MTARSLIGAEVRTLGTGVGLSATGSAGPVYIDFGTHVSGDLHLPSQPGFIPSCRVIIIFTGSVVPSGLDDAVSFTILDGPDENGQMGDPKPAVTDDGEIVGPVGYRSVMFGLQMQPGRPWLRCRLEKTNSQIEVISRAIVLAIPRC